LSKLGYDNIDDFFNTLKRKYDNELSEQDLETAYNDALKENEEKRGLFRYEDITKDYLVNLSRISQEQNKKLPRLDIVMNYLDRKMKTLYKIDTISNTNMKQTLYTTKKYFHIEKEAFNTLLELAEIPHQLADIKSIENAISRYEIRNGFTLTDEQKNAIYNVLHGASLSVINGHAGAGKTTSAEIISDVAKKQNLKIIALAPTGKASDELGKALKTDKAKTIDSFLLQDEYKEIDSNTIIFVDEAGMVDIYNLSELIKIAKQTGAKLVLQGDWKQLKPVDAGDLYTDIYNKLKKDNSLALTELRTIRRQKTEEYRDIATHLSEKKFQQAFNILFKNKGKYFSKYDNANIIQEFMQDPKDTLIVASTNDIKDELNTLIRKELMKESESEKEIEVRQVINDINSLDDLEIGYECEINKKRYTIKAINMYNNHIVLAPIETPNRDKRGRKKQEIELTLRELRKAHIIRKRKIKLAEGERIVALKNSYEIGIKNGEMFYVEKIDGNKIKLVNDNKELIVDIRKYNYFDYAYSITTHKSQGMTVRNVIVADANNNMNSNLFYVALTRGKENLKIYTNDIVNTLYKSQFDTKKHTVMNTKEKAKHISTLSRSEIAEMMLLDRQDKDMVKEYIKYIDDLQKKYEILRELKEKDSQQGEKISENSQDTTLANHQEKPQRDIERNIQIDSVNDSQQLDNQQSDYGFNL
ncbi:MAG: AAA family ATPase, partial [Thermoproteota archaeon]